MINKKYKCGGKVKKYQMGGSLDKKNKRRKKPSESDNAIGGLGDNYGTKNRGVTYFTIVKKSVNKKPKKSQEPHKSTRSR